MTEYVRVPREPTEAMIEAAQVYCHADRPGRASDIYRAMLAASPQGEGSSADWITHDGGPNPVPGKMVECRLAALGIPDLPPIQSECINWDHQIGSARVIAYRVTEGVKP